MSEKRLVLLVVSTLWVTVLWTLHPDALLDYKDIKSYRLFLYSDVEITWPTYIFFLCRHCVQLITIHVWWSIFEKYKPLFTVWFVIQAIQFVEYFMNYNTTVFFPVYFWGHRLDVDFTFMKIILVTGMYVSRGLWMRK